ncbi:MAG: class I SAM-dependent methyltransferase [Dokdonella sp.]
MQRKIYDRHYFDRWYRSPEHRVGSSAALKRKVALAVATTEYYLGRPVKTVLDIGCGEAPWRSALLRLRPKLSYRGLDSSEYVVSRYGRSRNIGLARFGDLEQLRFDESVDLLVCSDVLHYVRDAELRRGLAGFAELCHGLAFIETFSSDDAPGGDITGFVPRTALRYRKEFRRAGLVACGSHCYLSPLSNASVALLEIQPLR